MFDDSESPSKLIHAAKDVPLTAVRGTVRQDGNGNEDGDPSEDAAALAAETAGSALRASRENGVQQRTERAYRKSAGKTDRAAENVYADGSYGSDPRSGQGRKRSVRKGYASAYRSRGTGKAAKTGEQSAKAAKRSAEESGRIRRFVSEHRRGILISVGVFALIMVSFSAVSSCSVMLEGMASVVTVTTYPVSDSDMLEAEAMYCGMEEGLKEYLGSFERTHKYDECRFLLDDVGHDPYVLISAVTALRGGAWTADVITDTLALLFARQYTITENVVTETRYRTETVYDTYTGRDPYTGEIRTVPYVYTLYIPYEYSICTVTLRNTGLENLTRYLMNADQLAVYEMYMETLGNRPDLFPESEYVKNRKNKGGKT